MSLFYFAAVAAKTSFFAVLNYNYRHGRKTLALNSDLGPFGAGLRHPLLASDHEARLS